MGISPSDMQIFLFMLVYVVILGGIGIYLFVLLVRFVKAHQRIADALEQIAKTLAKPEP